MGITSKDPTWQDPRVPPEWRYAYVDAARKILEERKMKLRPLGSRIWVLPVTKKEEKIGSIYVPATAQNVEKPICGTVKAVGEEVKKVKVGDKVYYGRYAGTNLEVDQELLLFIKEEDIIAVEE